MFWICLSKHGQWWKLCSLNAVYNLTLWLYHCNSKFCTNGNQFGRGSCSFATTNRYIFYNKWGGSRDLTVMLQAVSLSTFLTFEIDFNKNTKTMTVVLIPNQRTSILIITRWKRNKGFDESRFSHNPLSCESVGMVERIKNLLFGSKQL